MMWYDEPPVVQYERVKIGRWRPRTVVYAHVNGVCIGQYPNPKEAKVAVASRLETIKAYWQSLAEEINDLAEKGP